MKLFAFATILLAAACLQTSLRAEEKEAAKETAEAGWTALFDGKSLDGWKANEEDKEGKVFSVVDGELVIKGGRAHLFYMGKDGKATFQDFEFMAKVKTVKASPGGSNSGLYFHTAYQAGGWPSKGYEAQVNNGFDADPRRTGSLYAIKDINEKLVPDGEWFDYYIKVEGKNIIIKINGKEVINYTEEENPKRGGGMEERLLKGGTFGIQAHDPGCEVHYKEIKVRELKKQ